MHDYCYGENPVTLREKYREANRLILKAWNGKYTKLRYVNLCPQPIQQPRPPIWVPGLGSIETWDWCIDHDYDYSYLSFSGYLRARKMLDGWWAQRAKRKADDNPYSTAFFQQVCVSDTDASCEKEWWPHVDYFFFNTCLHLYPGTSGAPGYVSEASLRAGIVSQVGNTSGNPGMNKTWKELVDQRYIVAGSPATVRQQLEELAKNLRVGHLAFGLRIGSAPMDLTNRSIHLLARDVLPHLRPLFREWDDRWSPKPLPAAERAVPGAYSVRAGHLIGAERPEPYAAALLRWGRGEA